MKGLCVWPTSRNPKVDVYLSEAYANESVFREIQPDTKIVIEHVVKPWYKLTATLTARGDQTHLVWIQEFENLEVAAKMRPLSETANEQVLDRLEALPGSESLCFSKI